MIRTSYCGGFPFCIEKEREQGMSSHCDESWGFFPFFAPSEKIGTTFRMLLTEKKITMCLMFTTI